MKNRKFILGFLLGVVFVLLSWLVISGTTVVIDNFVYECLKHNEVMTNVMKGITTMGEHITIVLLTVCGLMFVKDKRCFIFVGVTTLLVALLNSGLKLLFKRPRPSDLAIITESGYSFPSGHSIASMFFYGFIMYLVYKSNLDKKNKIPMMCLLGLLIFSIGLSRIYLGVHYASDVIGGFILGGLMLYLSIIGYNLIIRKDR